MTICDLEDFGGFSYIVIRDAQYWIFWYFPTHFGRLPIPNEFFSPNCREVSPLMELTYNYAWSYLDGPGRCRHQCFLKYTHSSGKIRELLLLCVAYRCWYYIRKPLSVNINVMPILLFMYTLNKQDTVC